ncbi:MAG: Uma2 family endonuclease [Acidobacteriaceae bacterium]|nr:Uma2 family endonuclease [Acidobacteriaceae bacterium]MBV9781069.1 Uma2 family endonuclease [Acidobacteriaceae bacterium]
MSSAQITGLSEEDYLKQERAAERKSEYVQGEVFLMAGASPEHVLIVTNLVGELRQQLRRGPCKVYSTDLRLRVACAGLYTYPDVMVICGSPAFMDERRDTVLNPTLIIEVLSESTKDYDRGRKFQYYRRVPSLKSYLTVAQDVIHVEQWTRQSDQHWMLAEFTIPDATISLQDVDARLKLADVYEGIGLTS